MLTPAAITAPQVRQQVRQQAGLGVLTWPIFDSLPVDALVTTRSGGVSAGPYASLNLSLSVGDDPASVLENRRRAATAVGATLDDLVFARQVHGAGVRIVTGADRGAGARDQGSAIGDADALVTADAGVVLGVVAADCVPIVLYDPAARVLGCAHAGWRGTVARVAGAALSAMGALGADPVRVIAGIGPAIAPGRYQVGEEVAAEAVLAFGDRAPQVLRPDGGGRHLFDLWAANRLVLREAGVPDEQIHLLAVPTGADPGLLFSHREQQPCGRFALLARLHEQEAR